MTEGGTEYGFRACVAADLRRYRGISRGRDPLVRLSGVDWLSLVSPRFAPMLLQRIGYALQVRRLGPLAKLVSLINFMIFGIEIATRCPIGPGLFFPHTQGTVIGARSIGRNATIYQGVTLGAKELDFGYSDDRRPQIGNDVLIGSGAKVLGGLSVGNGVRIGANTVVTKSLAPGVTAVGSAMRVIEGGNE
jgi:serine O-acetyltransferase